MNEKTRLVLEDIAKEGNRLKRFSFDEHVNDVGLGFRFYRSEGDGWITEFGQPDEKELLAFLIAFRLFIQQTEPISFHQLTTPFLNDSKLSDSLRSGFAHARRRYFDYLKGYPESVKPGFFVEGKQLAREEILKVVLTTLTHSRSKYPKKGEQYDAWTRDEIRVQVLQQEFIRIVLRILPLIYLIADLSEQELSAEVR